MIGDNFVDESFLEDPNEEVNSEPKLKKKYTEELFLQHQNERVNSVIIPRLKKKYSYEWEKIIESIHPYIWHDSMLCIEKEKIFDFWENKFDLSNLHFTDHRHIHYNLKEKEEENEICIPFILRLENICGIIDRGEKEDRNHYFKSSALLQTSYIHEIFAQIEDKMINDLNIDYHSIIDSGKFQIDSEKKLPLSQIIYLRNLIVIFEKVEQVTVRRRKKNKIVARIISGEILLNKNQ